MNEIRKIFSRLKRPVQNESGMAALIGVVFVIILLAAISANFIVETRQKQSGAAITHTSDNALAIAEAGLRMMEGCMLNNDAGCICNNGAPPNDCKTWDDPANPLGPYNNIVFAGGTFDLTFAQVDVSESVVTCVGKHKGAERVLSKSVTRPVLPCGLADNVVTTCQLDQAGGVTVTGSTVELPGADPLCQNNLVPNLPNPPGGPDFDNDCGLFPNPLDPLNPTTLDYDKFDMDGNTTCTINGPGQITITVDKDFVMKDTAKLIIDGADVIFEVKGKADFEDDSSIEVINGGTLKFHGDDKITVTDDALINVVGGDPANVLFMSDQDVKVEKRAQFVGAAISNQDVKVEDTAQFTGLIFAGDTAKLKNNSTIVIDPSAGGAILAADPGAITCP